MRILLAEDDPHISLIMQICLEKIGGHQVHLVEDGDAALQVALAAATGPVPFELVILDGMMPKKSGLQVAEELQRQSYPTPIIFLSAKAEDAAVRQFLALGTGYIAKPFDPQSICAHIDQILASAQARGAKAA